MDLATPGCTHVTALPYVSEHLPGIGGRLKATPDDFVVQEVPLYEASGDGPHVYVIIERQGWNTRDLARSLADLFGVGHRDVGYAGLKDRGALATQTFSLPLSADGPDDVAQRIVAELGVVVHDARRHRNKLKVGHLIGNRFTVTVREIQSGERQIDAIAQVLAQRGVPNFYGPQRFGAVGDNARVGREALDGRRRLQGWQRSFMLGAYQSELFNTWLVARIEAGAFGRPLAGDIAKVRATGGLFDVSAPELDAAAARFAGGEITYTGPIYGARMRWPTDEAGAMERAVLAGADVDERLLQRARLTGSRRIGHLLVDDLTFAIAPSNDVTFQFSLPKGSYATAVLREFMKVNPAAPEGDS